MRRVATKIFLTFAVALAAFALVAVFGIVRLHELRKDLRLLSGGYLALTRIAAQLDVKDWVATRALEARGLDRAARQAYLPVARAHFPVVREKIEEGRRVAAESRALARGGDARFLDEVSARLDALALRWSEYDAKARALFEATSRFHHPALLQERSAGEADAGRYWTTMGAVEYRAGNWASAIEALTKAAAAEGPDKPDDLAWRRISIGRFFRAMACLQLAQNDEARRWYDQAVAWMEKNAPKDEELVRFRGEAAGVLGITP